MLTLTCPYSGIQACGTELAPGYKAHFKRFGPGSTDEDFEAYMFAHKNLSRAQTLRPYSATFLRFKEGQFIDEAIAAGVAH